MKCIECGGEMFKITINSEKEIDGELIALSYDVYVCENCEGYFVEADVLERALNEALGEDE